jgi:hypothetical protein
MSQLVSKHYGCNTSRTVLFSKTVVMISLDAHITTIVVLTSGKLTVFKFCNYGKVWYNFWDCF